MKKIWFYIRSFFKPASVTIHLKVNEATAITAIENFTKGNKSIWFPDIEGSFVVNGNFEFHLVSGGYSRGIRYSSKFKGKVLSNQQGIAIVNARLNPGPVLYIFIGFGILYFMKCIVDLFCKPITISGIFLSFFIFAIPLFIYHISNAATIDRLVSFLKKESVM